MAKKMKIVIYIIVVIFSVSLIAKALEQDSKNMAGGMIFIIIVLIIIGIILFRTNIKNLIDKIKNKTSK